jgi:hypothetical protein
MTPLRAVLSTFFPSYEQATQATVSWQRVYDRVRGTVPIIENFINRSKSTSGKNDLLTLTHNIATI